MYTDRSEEFKKSIRSLKKLSSSFPYLFSSISEFDFSQKISQGCVCQNN